MNKKILATALSLLYSSMLVAGPIDIFTYSKSYHPKNVLHFFLNVKEEGGNCIIDQEKVFNIYWIMGHKGDTQEGMNGIEHRMFSPKILSYSENEVIGTNKVFQRLAGYVDENGSHKVLDGNLIATTYFDPEKGCQAELKLNTKDGMIVIQGVYVQVKRLVQLPIYFKFTGLKLVESKNEVTGETKIERVPVTLKYYQ